MAVYTPGRRRAILLLLLSSALLITLDLRGNAVLDKARQAFHTVSEPLRSAAQVVTKPLVNAWRGVTDYDDLREENERLTREVDAQRTIQIQSQAFLVEHEELLELSRLPPLSDYPSVVATVVGESPSNLDQVIEIDKGSNDGIEGGMSVVAAGGLVGKITEVQPDRATVMLVTDPRFSVVVKINPAPTPTTTTVPPSTSDPLAVAPADPNAPPTSPPAGTAPGETTTPGVTTTADPNGALPDFTTTTIPPLGSIPGFTPSTPEGVPTSVPSATTLGPPPTDPGATTVPPTTTIPAGASRDTGALNGRGPDRLPQVSLLSDTGRYGRSQIGDPVLTAGGTFSLAPPNLPVGVVRHVVNRSASDGPLLEIELAVDLDQLHFVSVVLYKPISETNPDAVQTDEGGN